MNLTERYIKDKTFRYEDLKIGMRVRIIDYDRPELLNVYHKIPIGTIVVIKSIHGFANSHVRCNSCVRNGVCIHVDYRKPNKDFYVALCCYKVQTMEGWNVI
jgi:hypothetical protein